MNLIFRLVLGIVAGILLGQWAPESLIRALLTFKVLFGELLEYAIPLIILFFIMSGIARLERSSGRLLTLTIVLAYASTTLAGLLAGIVGLEVVPHIVQQDQLPVSHAIKHLSPYFTLDIPPLTDISTALVTAFLFGIGISATEHDGMRQLADGGRDIVERFIAKALIPALPFYIAGLFCEMTIAGTVANTLKSFGMILLLALTLHWLWLSLLYVTSGTSTGRSPMKALAHMLPAYFTAAGTMSSAATIPVTVRQMHLNHISPSVASFAVPLLATIHMCGSAITLTVCAIGVMLVTPSLATPELTTLLPFIAALGVTIIAAPGSPGGAAMTSVGVLQSLLGFDAAAVGLMMALYLAQDSFGTACNVTGDGALVQWIDRFAEAEQDRQRYR
ncbi:dicarboxylate/amino acid:cation symporter [Cobetia amphilecti]|jgi:Na+/H+-dicarboxylate symporter|uniref:Dicarboxylate/amino acid:cation symporter n=1 Tax=Cobetia amphilecti TaxID=1055104 RepID=A0AAP4WZ75_9GAMM|nr:MULTISPECIES: dicarboxylate/amino acid:cation symporter [Cobetia]MBR9754591.1 dicarboxylate/amino acid:cation symporter [Gammaproteobacteria bacterium]TCJ26056.1 dicarboxylate/amino acid:cation symporter [Halomonas sp. GDM18]UTV88198.1 dicarboxylate/amino acid:cation symporter [Cobetia litoralis]MBR9797216.1 dicarboxylate/amino acid:cation symporter [Gammaproteobacteria bacterium]MCK8067367.1 dicarboxylate/amino acid:cation symporter [Cobetia sp. 1CM21F]